MSGSFRPGFGRRRRGFDPGPSRPDPSPRSCDWPGCDGAGEFRAPKSREHLREFRWFCLEHVRAYNRNWNFFAGMSQGEIEGYLREDVTWHRPTWRLGTAARVFGYRPRDPFEMFDAEDFVEEFGRRARAERLPPRVTQMLARLDLTPGIGLKELKERYKQLVKRHHPDLHGGDREAEERLKVINEAYTYLMESGLFT